MKKHYNIGKKNCNFIDNRTNKTHYCIGCGRKICWQTWIHGKKRCKSCARKYYWKAHPSTPKTYYCIDCKKEISYSNWKYGQRRCQSCANKKQIRSKQSKQKISLSLGGTGIPYEFNEYPLEYFKIRSKILKRDNYTCQLCNEYGNDVHHIDYNKENNEEENLICLCHKCNMKVNKDRNYWYAYFTYTMENKYVSL